jgi:hypothetical protein
MPRKAKTQSGKPAQAPQMIPGQQYGAQVAQAQLQTSMPAPDVRGAVPPPTAPAQPTPEMPTRTVVDPMAVAQAMKFDPLLGPTQRPEEPLTHGLSTGPGGGPEAIQGIRRSPVGDSMRMLTQVLGDPYFADLARRTGV